MSCETIAGCVNEDSAFGVLLRVQADGSDVQQADVSSIAYEIYSEDDQDTAHASGSLTVSAVVFDTLQTDGRWTIDTTGYNFKHDIAHTVLTDPGGYRIEYAFTMSGGAVIRLDPVLIDAKALWGK